jgi:hypothetical protein
MYDLNLFLDVLRVWLALLSLLATILWVFEPRDFYADAPEAPVRALDYAPGEVVGGNAADLRFSDERDLGTVVVSVEPPGSLAKRSLPELADRERTPRRSPNPAVSCDAGYGRST